jgi:hypothetical protein
MKNIIITVSSILFFISCKHKQSPSQFPIPDNISCETRYTSLSLDTIILNEDGVESSQMGFSGINKDNDLYFIDSRFCWYYVFDVNGNFKHRYLGQGGGPKETVFGKISTCCILPDTSLFFIGYQLDNYLYDKNFNKKNFFTLVDEYGKYTNRHDIDASENWAVYTYNYDNLTCRNIGNNKVYIDIYSEHPNFNYVEHTKEYLKKSKHILEIDISNGKAGKLFSSGYPPVYYENTNNYLLFSYINFDIDKDGNFYVNYEADSLIYKYDNNFNPLYSFGYSGINMDNNYTAINSFDEIKYVRNERVEKGYYSWIEFVEETEMLFRSYKKGIQDENDGLQIYSNKILIADISVPKGFKVAGYVAPYYYSQAIVNEKEEKMIVYRFKLDE